MMMRRIAVMICIACGLVGCDRRAETAASHSRDPYVLAKDFEKDVNEVLAYYCLDRQLSEDGDSPEAPGTVTVEPGRDDRMSVSFRRSVRNSAKNILQLARVDAHAGDFNAWLNASLEVCLMFRSSPNDVDSIKKALAKVNRLVGQTGTVSDGEVEDFRKSYEAIQSLIPRLRDFHDRICDFREYRRLVEYYADKSKRTVDDADILRALVEKLVFTRLSVRYSDLLGDDSASASLQVDIVDRRNLVVELSLRKR